MVHIPLGDRKCAVSELSLNNPEIDFPSCKEGCTGMTKPMDVNPLCYAPLYSMTRGEFTHIAAVNTLALVTREEEALIIVGPGGYPVIKLPRCLPINPNNPTLATLAFEYSDGTSFRIDVTHPKVQDLRAAQLAAEGEHEDHAVPPPCD